MMIALLKLSGKMKTTLPPRRTLLLYSWSGERRRGKVFERLKHKNHDTPM
jgi:hypothetical protein